MNNRKRLLSLILALLMAFTLCACADDADVSGTTVKGTPSAEPTDEAKALDLGTVSGGEYKNAYFGFGCTFDEEWVYADEDQLLGMVQDTADLVDDEDYKAELLKADIFYDMAVTFSDEVTNINVVVQNIKAVFGSLLDEEALAEELVKQLPAELEAASMQVQTCELVTVDFAGAEHSGAYIHSLVSGIDLYQLQVYVKVGNYLAAVTLSSTLEENLDAMLTYFYAV